MKRYIQTIIFCAITISSVLMSSCANEWLPWSKAEGNLSIPFSIEGCQNGSPASRSFMADDGSTDILHDVAIALFSADEKYMGTIYAMEYNGGSLGADNQLHLEIPSGMGLTPGEPYKLLIYANSELFPGKVPVDVSGTEYQWMKRQLVATGQVSSTAYPLRGEYVDASGNPVDMILSEEEGILKANGMIRFKRSVARIDFQNLCTDKLIVESVAVCNDPLGGYYFHDDIIQSSLVHIERRGVSDLTEASWVELPGWRDNDGTPQVLEKSLYCFPSVQELPDRNDHLTTCLLIKGYYQDGADNTPANRFNKATYYRFNIAESGMSQSLLSNHRYCIKIDEVSAPGEVLDAFAYQDVIQWSTVSHSVGEANHIIVDGFDPRIAIWKNDVTEAPLAIKVNTVDAAKFRIQVESDFDSNVDAYLSQFSPQPRKLPLSITNNRTAHVLENVPDGSTVYLNVYRTGPGDPDFTREIRIKAFDKVSGSDVPVKTITIPVTITTSCIIGDAICNNTEKYNYITHSLRPDNDPEMNNLFNNNSHYVICDRNYGAAPRISATGVYEPALNYNYTGNFVVGGYDACDRADRVALPENADIRKSKYHGGINQHWGHPSWVRSYGDCLTDIPKFANGADGSTWYDEGAVYSPFYRSADRNKWECCHQIVAKYIDGRHSWMSAITKNACESKLRIYLLSDYKDAATGKYVACWLPWCETFATVGNYNESTHRIAWDTSHVANWGPQYNQTHHTICYNFTTGCWEGGCAHPNDNGNLFTRPVGTERPLRWLSRASDWPAYVQWHRNKYGCDPIHR